MWNGKKKAITFSYDDGVEQDVRLLELFRRYGLKGTFNLNSQLLGKPGELMLDGVKIAHNKVAPDAVAALYRGQEVAAHTLTHPRLTDLSGDEIVRQVEQDRITLSALCGSPVVGMAYPCGDPNHDDRVVEILRRRTGVRYARTVRANHAFTPQTDLLRFHPTVRHTEPGLSALVEDFLAAPDDAPRLLYIWGHSYELDLYGWEPFEEILKRLSFHDEIFYGTNSEVFFG